MRVMGLMSACFLMSTTAVHADVIDKVVAVVNDSIITLSDLNTAAAIRTQDLENIGRPDERKRIMETRSKTLDSLIEKKLVEQASNKAGITVSEREIDNAIDDVKKHNNLTHDALLKALAANGLTSKEYRNQLKDQIRQVKFINKEFRSKINIPGEDIEAYYNQNIERFYEPQNIRLRQIFLPFSSSAKDSDRREVLEKANEIIARIRQGEDFAKLASRYSQGSNAEIGGDIGFVKIGEMDSQIEKISLSLKIGETSGVIRTNEGLHIIQVTDKKEKQPKPFDAVKEEIRRILFQNTVDERYKLWLEEQKRSSYIDVRL